MEKPTRVFTRHEIYDLVNAEYSALEIEKEAGVSSGWDEITDSEKYKDKLLHLGETQVDRFEKLLRSAAHKIGNEVGELMELKRSDYESEVAFVTARKEIQNKITEKTCIILSDFVMDKIEA